MGFLGSIGDALGLSKPDFPSAREKLTEEEKEFREELRETIRERLNLSEDEEIGPPEVAEYIQTLDTPVPDLFQNIMGQLEEGPDLAEQARVQGREEVERTLQSGREQLSGELERRGLQESGIAAEAQTRLLRDALRATADVNRGASQLEAQELERRRNLAQNLSGQSLRRALSQQQLQQNLFRGGQSDFFNAFRSALQLSGQDIGLAQQASQTSIAETTSQQKALNSLLSGIAAIAAYYGPTSGSGGVGGGG